MIFPEKTRNDSLECWESKLDDPETRLGQNEPREEQQGDPEEHFRQELIFFELRCSGLLAVSRCRSHVVEVETAGEEAERKRADAKLQMKFLSK